MDLYSREDHFVVNQSLSQVQSVLSTHLRSLGCRVEVEAGALNCRLGSDLMFRLFGAAVPIGRKNIPVGATVRFEPSDGDGTALNVRTYDRLGWYMNKRLLWGGQEELERKPQEGQESFVSQDRPDQSSANESHYSPEHPSGAGPAASSSACGAEMHFWLA